MTTEGSMEALNTIRTMLELGWPAIVLIFLFIIWAEYRRVTREYIDTLREVAALRPSLQNKSLKHDTGELRKASGA